MENFMERALGLAKKADPFPNPRVGAVLVRGGRIIGEGYHRRAGEPHAEIEAIRHAEKGGHSVRGATLYVTLEPCSHKKKRTPPCTEAILAKGIRKVVYAMKDPNPKVCGAEELDKAGVRMEGPTDEMEARMINTRYISAMKGRPEVAIKMAMSLDGRTATRTGDSRWISCKESRELVHRMRSEYDAVMVGSGTVNKDDPRLTARIKGGRDPFRIIIDSDLCIPIGSKALKKDGKAIVAASEKPPMREVKAFAKGSGAHVLVCGKEHVDLKALVEALGSLGISRILIEGGSGLNAHALEAGIVDRFYLFIAPKIIGGREAKGVVGGQGVEKVAQAIKARNLKARKVGRDILLEFGL